MVKQREKWGRRQQQHDTFTITARDYFLSGAIKNRKLTDRKNYF